MDPNAVFREAAGGGGSQATGFLYPIAARDGCVIRDGVHVYAGRNCPHAEGTVTDEVGVHPPVGWTSQQGNVPLNERQSDG